MKAQDINKILHDLKPDGHGSNPLAIELHRLANTLQEQTDKVCVALTGKFHPWPGHSPLELDHSEHVLNDIIVRGLSISEHLAAGLWEEAEAYCQARFSTELSESTRRVIARMDASDLRSAHAA